MEQADFNLPIVIIRESVSLFVLLVFITLAYKLADKFGDEFLEELREIKEAINDIAEKQ